MMMSHLLDLATQAEAARRLPPLFIPTVGSEEELVEATIAASLEDASPEGKRLLAAARKRLATLAESQHLPIEEEILVVERVRSGRGPVREGELDQVERWVKSFGGMIHNHLRRIVRQVQGQGGRAVVIANRQIDLGVVCFVPRRP